MRPRVKICGITRAADAELAVALGADAVGFVLWDRSPRHVDPDVAAAIARRLPAFVARVGVVVDTPPATVRDMVARIGLDVVQLHGDEPVDAYRDVGARIVKAVGGDAATTESAVAHLPSDVTVLIDAIDPDRRGGTGRTVDWSMAARLAAIRPIVLAGGLRAENVATAIRTVNPWGLDVSSGVEAAPGIKDADRLRQFFTAVRSAEGEER